eukprot:SAG25_NODE_666_length_6056_cov_2.690280_1_plen_50_part_10
MHCGRFESCGLKDFKQTRGGGHRLPAPAPCVEEWAMGTFHGLTFYTFHST